MLKSRNPLFSKTLSKQYQDIVPSIECDTAKTRRSYFKFSKNQNLNTIIKDLQKNVKQLKNYHESLQKGKTMKLQKSSSLNEIHKFRCSTKNKLKTYLPVNGKRQFNRVSDKKSNKENECRNSGNLIMESTVSKYLPENGSTMLSIHNADVEEVKKAYAHIYGKENTNIVDLYNFFRKNIQKSTRIYGGSIQMSTYPHGQHSEDMIKSRQHYLRKSHQFLNVIVEDKQQKQVPVESSSKTENQSSSVYKISAHRNLTMEQIFKNGCSDLANVYDFVKKRRVSVKNYMNFNRSTDRSNQAVKEKENDQSRKIRTNEPQVLENKSVKFQIIEKNMSSPCAAQKSSIHKKSMDQEPQLSQQKYLPSKSSKKSQKSSIKKSKQIQINLDENIRTEDINQFNMGNDWNQSRGKQNENKQNIVLDDKLYEKIQSSQEKKLDGKFRKSKYYVEPVPVMKQNSLQGCSISVKSSSRIIELDFIPLDL